VGVPLGSLGQLGLRNAMTNAYSGFIPAFGFKTEEGNTEAVGGHFWDGRADTLALQALGPFLNPKEMNNASAKVVMDKIAVSSYANLFRQEFGANVFANADTAYTQVGVAIEAFERADRLQSFTSKYDAFVRGQVKLAPAEERGMALFTDANKGNCAACHLMNPASGKPQDSLFSEFTYYATGIPRNAAIPSNTDTSFFDLGLCGPNRAKPVLPSTVPATVSVDSFCGMFRMPTLRNVAERPAFMHNGVFKDLRQVVSFYATRNSNPERWYGPTGVPNDLPTAYLGNIEKTKPPFNRTRADGPALTATEVNDVVAFLGTLSDGFSP
jgi:cytochrome c peroxidase